MEKNTKIFIIFLLSNLLLNYDTGVIPASLLEIEKEINFDYKEQALLGSLVYLGLSTASLFVSPIISKFGAKDVCAFVLLLNSLCCFIFSLSFDKIILFSTRFFMGVTESFVVIYGPVWVNNYSPKDKGTTWLGILHATTIFGMIGGYIVSGIVINFLYEYFNWRLAIQIQGIFLIPIAILLFLEDDSYISIHYHSIEEEIEARLNRYNSQKNLKNPINITIESKNSRKIKSDIYNSERAQYIHNHIYASNENMLKEVEEEEEEKISEERKENEKKKNINKKQINYQKFNSNRSEEKQIGKQ
jgi:cyanate permease